MVITENYIIHRRGIINMDKIPMWIQKAIAIFIIYVVVIFFTTYLYQDWDWDCCFYFNSLGFHNDLHLDVGDRVEFLIIIGIPFSLAVSWLIENIKRK